MTLEKLTTHARDKVAHCKRLSLAKAVIAVEHLEALLDALAEKNAADPVGEAVRDRLWKRELQLVRLFAREPATNAELARQMGTTVQVVKNHFRRIFDETGMSGRTELYAFLLKHPAILEETKEEAA